ncbi:hypothetical protein ACP179_01525 (plasmid) [Xenorhabdus stockiae]|uniref:hypothetical protein n=1 Tax=Xenorhabdus stockiae TaxID=351614 RepID=UPI003CEDE6C8
MNNKFPDYIEEIVREDVVANFEESISKTLGNFQWASDSTSDLIDRLSALINAYDGYPGEMRAITIYWLLSDHHEYEEKTNIINNKKITYIMKYLARLMMNESLKEIATQTSFIEKH